MILALLLLLATLASAQQVVSARAGLLYYVDGAVSLDARPIGAILPNHYPQLRAGQVLDTGAARAELLLGPEAMLWLDRGTRIHFEDTRLEDTLLVLDEGAAIVEVLSTKGRNRLRVSAAGVAAEPRQTGVYRFDASPAAVRVFDGEAIVQGATARDGQRAALAAAPAAERFDRNARDDFHYWAAYRSHRLRTESSAGPGNWRPDGRGVVTHTGFGVDFGRNAGTAWLQYLTAVRAGTVNYIEGNVAVNQGGVASARGRVPLMLDAGGIVGSARGRAEILLGPGVVLRIGENAQVRLLDASLAAPAVAVERGSALLEVTASRTGRARVQVGSVVTELVKEGLYEFDAAGALRVYGGEALTATGAAPVKTKSGQMLDLTVADQPRKLDAPLDTRMQNALFRWSAARSFALFRTGGDLMANWDARGFDAMARHPQFGSQPYRSGPVRRR